MPIENVTFAQISKLNKTLHLRENDIWHLLTQKDVRQENVITPYYSISGISCPAHTLDMCFRYLNFSSVTEIKPIFTCEHVKNK